jgi:hypothetical protein
MRLSLMNMLGLSSNVRITHIACYWKFFSLHYIQVLCQYRLWKTDHTYLMYLMLKRQISHLNCRKLDHRQVQASYTFYVWLRLVLYYEHVHSENFIWRLLIACTILLSNRIRRKVESRVQIFDSVNFRKLLMVLRNLFFFSRRCKFKR